MNTEAPSTVNPSLWRQGQLNSLQGLYKVTEGIYQIRGFDLANMTFVATNNGWIVIDPLTCEETAKAGLDFVNEQLGEKPIKAVILTHTHADHFGGVKGIISQQQLDDGSVELIAPEGFYHHAISENIIAGNGMTRRAMYQFGNLLPADTAGLVGTGLGQAVSFGTIGILKPTITISETGQRETIDGIEMIFQNTPGGEAPAECMFYFPKYKAFCQAEEINHTLHNLYTLRGAQVRDGLIWSKYIDETIQLFGGEVEISFGSHHWPVWGKAEIMELWTKQRDIYKYIHDETLYLANNGFTMLEIADMIKLPPSLDTFFANRDYYGTVSHNSKAQYQLYFGWFDGNPANLNALPPNLSGKKYVEYMGGSAAILEKVKADIQNREFRWAAMVLNHVIFAEPKNEAARSLLATVYRNMAATAESGPWRNFYLTGAQELEEGVTLRHSLGAPNTDGIVTNLTLEGFYDYMGVRLDRSKAKGKNYVFNMVFPDVQDTISLYLVNEVLHNRPGVFAPNANATITMNRSVFNDIITKKTTGLRKVLTGDIKIEGSRSDYSDFQGMIESDFNKLFNIVEP
jgi:alkyl sulfatase BDS1-like metallo-beta-lactamase superfamily hydrolase